MCRSALASALALLLVAGTLEARDPTAQETQLWDRSKSLLEDVDDDIRRYAGRIEDKSSDYELSPYGREDSESGTSVRPFTSSTKEMDELFKGLAELEKKMAPLAEAVAELEKTMGSTPADVEKKTWAEFGKPVNKDERNYGHESPDRSKWLETDVNWPFKWYPEAKKALAVPAAWRQRVGEVTLQKLEEGIAAHEKQYSEYTDVDPQWLPVERIRRYLPALEMVMGHLPNDAKLAEGKAKLEASIKKWQDWCDTTVDDQRMKEDTGFASGDDIPAACRKLFATSWAQQFDAVKGAEILAVVVTGNEWFTADQNLLNEPIQYGLWVQVAAATPAEKEKGLARLHDIKMYTKSQYGIAKSPPFEDFGVDRTYLIRLSNVGSDGGGGGGFLKFICGMGCCFLFLAAAGGGGFFAYKQMNAPKAAGPAGAPAAPGSAPAPGAPPAPPTG